MNLLYLCFNVHLCWMLLLLFNIRPIAMCPQNCSCNPPDHSSILSIDCKLRPDNFINDSIETEINEMLVERNQLNQLIIRNTRLKNVPMELCNIKSLTSLYMDCNQIERLPDNCFTRLQRLVEIVADHNDIQHLQVGNCYIND